MNELEQKQIEEITEKAIRKDEDRTMCDLLDKEIEELTKQKEIQEMAKILKGYCCLIGGKPTKGDCYQCKQANASCFDYAKLIYNAGYRNCKDKVVLTEREHEIAMKNQYDVGFRFGCKKMQEENGQLRLENNDLEAENDKLKEELRQASELKAETIKHTKMETAREILATIKSYDGWNELQRLRDEIAEEYEVEVE